MQVIENGMGNKAPATINNPPHFLVFFNWVAIFSSKYFFTGAILDTALPIKYDMIPPIYDRVAKMKRYSNGSLVFLDQAINISGGINPKKDSEAKKVASIPETGNVSVMNCKLSLILKTYVLKSISTPIISNKGIIVFFKLRPTKL